MISSAERLTRLIDDLLDVSRLRTGQMRLRLAELDLEELVRQEAQQAQDMAPTHGF